MSNPIIPRSDSVRQLPLFDVIEVPLPKGYKTLIDPIDVDLLAWRWNVQIKHGGKCYACRIVSGPKTKRWTWVGLHRLILERKLGRQLLSKEYTDHINGDSLDNRRDNLRVCTCAQNLRNARKRSDNTSGYKGVTYRSRDSIWEANIQVDGKQIYLGRFQTAEAAYGAYCEAAVKYHGEFARFK